MTDSTTTKLETVSRAAAFGGSVQFLRHASDACSCDMEFSVFLPPQAQKGPCPILWWLSGLTCTADNFTTKAGAQRIAAQHGFVVVAPDTSPRGGDVPDVEAYDLGCGAGFYLNATQAPWATHFHMYDYVVTELPGVIESAFPVDASRQGIFGHSMGGHGALTIALKNPGRYKSVSAFAPIVAPIQVPWGKKALTTYLGDDPWAWAEYDATMLVSRAAERLPILIDQGDADGFLEEQLKPHLLKEACEAAGHPIEVRMQPGYDHSYYFIASFMEDHFTHHAKALGPAQ